MHFYGESVDIVLEGGKPVVSGQTTELRDWIFNHDGDFPSTYRVWVGKTNENIAIDEYMAPMRDEVVNVAGATVYSGKRSEVAKWIADHGDDLTLDEVLKGPENELVRVDAYMREFG